MIKTKSLRRGQDQQGMLIVALLLVMSAFTLSGIALISFTSTQYRESVNNTYLANAISTAEAGVEVTLDALNQDDNFTGYATEQTFFNDATQGKAVYSTVVSNIAGSNAKTIVSTAKVYRFSNLTKPVSTRKVKVTVVGTGSPGYSVHTGPGGLILGGSASVTNSQVYVNGGITLTGTASIGTNSQPLQVNVANQRCPLTNPPGATYPTVCASGEPISMAYSTNIYGTVCATRQVSKGPRPGGNILPGSTGQGLQTGCVAPTVDTPDYDRAGHIASVTTTSASNNNTYVCNNWPFDRTWPANLKLTGNVSIASSCNVTVKGNVYITGDLNLGGASRITVDESAGGTRPVIIVDGKITVGGSAQIITNSQGTGIQFISFKSSAACGANCTTLTGNDLKTSQALETVDIGGAVNLPGMIFQAYWGKLTLDGSGNVGSIMGQTIDMSGAGTVTFGTTLSSGSTTWTVTSYQRLIN